MSKERLDVLLVSRGLAESREKAKAIIMSMLMDRRKIRQEPVLMIKLILKSGVIHLNM